MYQCQITFILPTQQSSLLATWVDTVIRPEEKIKWEVHGKICLIPCFGESRTFAKNLLVKKTVLLMTRSPYNLFRNTVSRTDWSSFLKGYHGRLAKGTARSSWFDFRTCMSDCPCMCVCVWMTVCPGPLGRKSRGYNILLLFLTLHNLHQPTFGLESKSLELVILDSVWHNFSPNRLTGMDLGDNW